MRNLLKNWLDASPDDVQRARSVSEIDLLYGDSGSAMLHLQQAMLHGLDETQSQSLKTAIEKARLHGASDQAYQGTSK